MCSSLLTAGYTGFLALVTATNAKQSDIERVMTRSTELGLHDDGYKMTGHDEKECNKK